MLWGVPPFGKVPRRDLKISGEAEPSTPVVLGGTLGYILLFYGFHVLIMFYTIGRTFTEVGEGQDRSHPGPFAGMSFPGCRHEPALARISFCGCQLVSAG